MGKRVGAVSILIVTLLGMYAIAYIYHTYYGISTPIVNSVLAFGNYGILAILLINNSVNFNVSLSKRNSGLVLIITNCSNHAKDDSPLIAIISYAEIRLKK